MFTLVVGNPDGQLGFCLISDLEVLVEVSCAKFCQNSALK